MALTHEIAAWQCDGNETNPRRQLQREWRPTQSVATHKNNAPDLYQIAWLPTTDRSRPTRNEASPDNRGLLEIG